MISSLSQLLRALKQLPRYRRADHVPTLLSSYSGEDWRELNFQSLYEDKEDRFRLELFRMGANRYRLEEHRRYQIRVLDGSIELVTPEVHHRVQLYPQSGVKEYFTRHRTFLQRDQRDQRVESVALVYSESLNL